MLTRRAKAALAFSIFLGLSGAGTALFSALTASAGAFAGPFSGTAIGDSVQPGESYVAAGLGEDMSFRKVTITGGSASDDALSILSGKLRLAPITALNATIYFDSAGFNITNQLNIAPGAPIFVDYVLPRQSGIPVTVGDSDGTTFACQSSPGTCDATHKGAVLCVNETASSATRLCRCILTTSLGGVYRWLNMDNATRGTTTTDCPDTAP